MNLIQFLKQVDKATSGLSKDRLEIVIHNLARTLSEEQRDEFLKKLHGAEVGSAGEDSFSISLSESYNSAIQAKLINLREKLRRIEEGTCYLVGNLNEEYDDWYDSSEDEFLFEDPKHVADIIGEACDVIHQCVDQELYEEAYQLASMVLALRITVEGDYSDYMESTLIVEDMETRWSGRFDFRQLVLDGLYAAYCSKPLEERPKELYQIIDNLKYHQVTLEKLMQQGKDGLDQLDEFLKLWITYLGSCGGNRAKQLLKEAVSLNGNFQQRLETAREFSGRHPELYEQLLEDLSADGNEEKRLAAGQEGLRVISPQLVVRSRIALLTAESALRLNEREEAERCWLEAFRSDTKPIHYMRLAVESHDFAKYRNAAREIYREFAGKSKKDEFVFWQVSQTGINVVSGNELHLLAFLDGDFQSVVKYGMNVQSALGWSSTFMKIGIAWFLLYLYRGEELSTGCKSMCRFAADAAGFTAEKYMRGLAESADISAFSLFWDRFCRWKQMVSMPGEEQEQILKQLDQWIRLRVDGIMQGNYRKHYGECASFIAALGEVKESRGKAGEKERLLESYKAAYSRRTAFHKELRAFGMKA